MNAIEQERYGPVLSELQAEQDRKSVNAEMERYSRVEEIPAHPPRFRRARHWKPVEPQDDRRRAYLLETGRIAQAKREGLVAW